MNKQQFDTALQEAATWAATYPELLQEYLAELGLRIVPSEPVAWQHKVFKDGFLEPSEYDELDEHTLHQRPLFADPEN